MNFSIIQRDLNKNIKVRVFFTRRVICHHDFHEKFLDNIR